MPLEQVYGQPGNLYVRNEQGEFVPLGENVALEVDPDEEEVEEEVDDDAERLVARQEEARAELTRPPTLTPEEIQELTEQYGRREREITANVDQGGVGQLLPRGTVANPIPGWTHTQVALPHQVDPAATAEDRTVTIRVNQGPMPGQEWAWSAVNTWGPRYEEHAREVREAAERMRNQPNILIPRRGDMASSVNVPASGWTYPATYGGPGLIQTNPEGYVRAMLAPEFKRELLDEIRKIVQEELSNKLKEGVCAQCLCNPRVKDSSLCQGCLEKFK